MDEKRKSLTSSSSDEYLPKKKSLLEELVYCLANMEIEPESIKRYYINPEEISEISEVLLSDE